MRRHKYLLIILLSAVVLLAALVFFFNRDAGIYLEGKDKELIQQIFGIEKSQYEIVHVENSLDHSNYGGSYRVTLKMSEEQLEEFRKEIEHMFAFALSEEEKAEIRFMIENATGIEPGENDLVYSRMSKVMRTIYGHDIEEPKTSMSTVVCLEPVDGISKVVMNYAE
ncbi:MAG: hypothetical protein HFI75_14110 [Lachnospiraceae bacterium]|nr:hypothetical protein [Lachnospiraceae bacterium]